MNSIEKLVGFEYIKNLEKPCTSYGIKYYNNIPKSNSVDELMLEYSLLEKCFDLDDLDVLRSLLSGIKDINITLDSIKKGYGVTVVELYEVKFQALHTLRIASALSENVVEFECVEEILNILGPKNNREYNFNIYDQFDEELSEILRKKREIEVAYNNAKHEEKSRLKVKRDEIIIKELTCVDRVVKDIVMRLCEHVDSMITNIEKLCKLDVLITKTLIHKKYIYCVPSFQDEIKISNGILPLVSDDVDNYVPLNMDISRGSTLISGANMGGKSTALKNIAFQYMLMINGFMPMCEEFSGPFIDKILYMQQVDSTDHGLSRFGNEIIFVSDSLDKLDDKTLFLVDEFASSTNPDEGKKFMKSLIELCNNKRSFSIFTTHFGNLGHLCNFYKVKGLKQELLEKDVKVSDLMDYRIEKSNDYEVDKQALNVAKHLDINKELLSVLEDNYERGE